ncbi:MAG: tRNA lysidine(34) synthetase TilS C-terminal domain-containing protein [Blautia marasmi]
MIDCKIPRQERENLTLLADGSHIVWVVGYRISEYYKITGQTKTVIKVQVKGEKEDE